MLDLPETWQDELQKIFAYFVPDFDVWAYGSRVSGTNHPASDLDIVLIHKTKPGSACQKLTEIREALRQSNLPISVDVMDWAAIPEPFHANINANKVQLFN